MPDKEVSALPRLLADASGGLASSRSVPADVERALSWTYLSDSARKELKQFQSETPLAELASMTVSAQVYAMPNLTRAIGGVTPYELVWIPVSKQGEQVVSGHLLSGEPRKALKVRTSAGMFGWVAEDAVAQGRVAVAFRAHFNKSAPEGQRIEFDNPVVASVLDSSIVYDVSLKFDRRHFLEGLTAASQVRDYLRKYTDVPDGPAELLPPSVLAFDPDKDGVANFSSNNVLVSMVIFPLDSLYRKALGSVTGDTVKTSAAIDLDKAIEDSNLSPGVQINGDVSAAVPRELRPSSDVDRRPTSNYPSRVSGAEGAEKPASTGDYSLCETNLRDLNARPARNVRVFIQSVKQTNAFRTAQKIRALLLNANVETASSIEVAEPIVVADQVRVCSNQDVSGAVRVNALLNSCGMGSFSLLRLPPCKFTSGGNPIEVWVGNRRPDVR